MRGLSVICYAAAALVVVDRQRILLLSLLAPSALLLLDGAGRCRAFSAVGVVGPSLSTSWSHQPRTATRRVTTTATTSYTQISMHAIYNHYYHDTTMAINFRSGSSSAPGARCFATSIRSTLDSSSASSAEAVEHRDDKDDDNDNDDNTAVEEEQSLVTSYGDCLGELQALTRITSRDRAAVDRALEVVDRMRDRQRASNNDKDDEYDDDDDDNNNNKQNLSLSVFPDTAIYNQLLAVLAFSAVPEAADQAAQIVARMEQQQQQQQSSGSEEESTTTTAVPRPDSETYATLMDAYMQRHDYDRVLRIVDNLKARDASLVDAVVLNKLIQCHGRRGDPAAARQILDDMLANDTDDDSDQHLPQPNHKTWVQVLRAHAVTGDAETVQELLEMMGKDWGGASTAARNALLQAHAVNGDAARAEQVLYEMLNDSDGDDETCCQPDPQSFNFLLQAYRRQSPRPGVAFKVERCLSLFDACARKQEQQQQQQQNSSTSSDKNESWKLSERTLATAVAAMSRDTTDPLKAVKAAKLLQERLGAITAGDDDADGDDATRSSVYRSLLNACAHTTTQRARPEDRLATWKVAIDAWNQLPPRHRDARACGQFLRAAGRLLPPGAKRDRVVANVFAQCTAAGCVDDHVLEMFAKAASDQLLLATLGGFVEDGVELPEEWSRKTVVVDKEQ